MRKSVIFVLVFVVAALGWYLLRSGQPANAQTITLERSLLALLPPDATTLVGVDVERLKQTAVYRRFEEENRITGSIGDSHFNDFMAATGFDPRRDVQELLIAALPVAASADPSASQFVAVARGQFNVGAIGRKLRQEKAVVENYRGFEVFSSKRRAEPPRSRNQSPREPGAFTFLDEKTALAGTRGALLAAIDRKAGGGPSLLSNAALLGRAQTIGATSQVWAVSESPGEVVTRALPKDNSVQSSNFARIFAGMKNSTFALDLMNGLDLRAAGVCKTPEDAKTLGDAARGFVAIGRLTVSQKEPELMAVFDGIRVEERNTELDISVRVDPANFEKLLDKTRPRKPARSAD